LIIVPKHTHINLLHRNLKKKKKNQGLFPRELDLPQTVPEEAQDSTLRPTENEGPITARNKALTALSMPWQYSG
jgi:hypothetical protein